MTIGPQKLGPYWLIGATTFSRIGTLAYTVVMTWAVSKAGGNNSVGWVNAAAGFTIVLVGISAAFWLDKFDKRTLLLLLDVFAAVVCLAAAAVHLSIRRQRQMCIRDRPHNKQHLFYHLLSPHTSTPAGPTTPGQRTQAKGTYILPKRSRYHQTFDSAG